MIGPFPHVTSGYNLGLNPERRFKLWASTFFTTTNSFSSNFEPANTTGARINSPCHFLTSTTFNASGFGSFGFTNSAFLRRDLPLKFMDLGHVSLTDPTV
jgi:hypothetical protein